MDRRPGDPRARGDPRRQPPPQQQPPQQGPGGTGFPGPPPDPAHQQGHGPPDQQRRHTDQPAGYGSVQGSRSSQQHHQHQHQQQQQHQPLAGQQGSYPQPGRAGMHGQGPPRASYGFVPEHRDDRGGAAYSYSSSGPPADRTQTAAAAAAAGSSTHGSYPPQSGQHYGSSYQGQGGYGRGYQGQGGYAQSGQQGSSSWGYGGYQPGGGGGAGGSSQLSYRQPPPGVGGRGGGSYQAGYGSGGRQGQQPQWGGQGSSASAAGAGSGAYYGGAQQGGYGSGGSSRVVPGEHARGVSRAQHQAPYDRQDAGRSGGGRDALIPLQEAQHQMQGVLTNKPHNHIEAEPAPGSSSQLVQTRRGHGSVAMREAAVLVNLFRLTVNGQVLYHYDVSYARLRPARSRDPDAAPQVFPLERPPEAAREIMDAFVEQYLPDKECWAFDGGKNLLTSGPVQLKGGAQLPLEMDQRLVVTVRDVPADGSGKKASWQLTFQLARVLTRVDEFPQVPSRIAELLAAGRDIADMQQFFSSTRQPLEWTVKQALIAAHKREVMEVRRTLYFCDGPGNRNSSSNRNIGGMLRAFVGLTTGIRQGEGQVMVSADMTASAFLRTDINLVECLADLADCHRPPAGGGGGRGGGRGGSGGGWGRGRGRSLPETGAPDIDGLMRLMANEGIRSRLLAKFGRSIRNKKVVHKDPAGNVLRKFTAVGLTPQPADQALFFCNFKQPAADGSTGAEISVAYYFEHLANPRQPLRYPQLPAVVMKVPKPKEGEEPRKIWVPMERLWFDKNQRVQAVTHKGGTEQMIEAARKQPGDLAAAIQQPVSKATTTSTASASSSSGGAQAHGGGKQVLDGMNVQVDSRMQQIKARVLPGPWLKYRQGPAGREETRAYRTGVSGVWNMNNLKFSNPASLLNWGVVALLPRRREFERPPNPYNSLGSWVLDFINRCHALGMDLGFRPQDASVVAAERLRNRVMRDMEWLEEGEDAPAAAVQGALQRVRERAGGNNCQLILCFINHKPSGLYSRIKVVSELVNASGGLGLVTQVVVASKTDLGSFARGQPNPSRRSQYQANLAMKVNAKVGGVNTCWSVLGQELLRGYFSKAVPPIQVFGIDITHPGKVPGARSKAGVVGSLDPAFGRYAWSTWEEEGGGTEVLSGDRMRAAFKDLITRYYTANNGQQPGCLLVYRDGVSDSELQRVRQDEVRAVIEACAELSPDGSYRPRIVYMVVQKRQHVRLFDASQPQQLRNCEPGTVVDHTIVSPEVCDFYLCSHKEISGAGTSRVTRYICLLDELGFGPDGLQCFTYWLCYLYCRCTRAVSVVAPVYYAHLLAYRVRFDGGADDSTSFASGSSAGAQQESRYCDSLADKMFFV